MTTRQWLDNFLVIWYTMLMLQISIINLISLEFFIHGWIMPLDHMSERRESRRIFEYKWRHTIHFCIFYMIIFQAFMLLYHAVCMQILAEERVKEEMMMKLEKMMKMIWTNFVYFLFRSKYLILLSKLSHRTYYCYA